MSLTYMRVTSRLIEQSEGTNALYDVSLELSNHGRSSEGHGDPGNFPHPPAPAPSIVQQVSGRGNLTMPSAITAGNTLVYDGGTRSSTSLAASWGYASDGYTVSPAGETNDGSDGMAIVYKLAGASERITLGIVSPPSVIGEMLGTWYELAGEWTPDASATGAADSATVSAGPITVPANAIVFGGITQGAGGAYDTAASAISYTPGTGWTEDYDYFSLSGHPNVWNAHQITTTAGTVTLSALSSGGAIGFGPGSLVYTAQVVSFTSSTLATSNPPIPGATVPWTVVTFTTGNGVTSATTAFPYASGSLQVRVNALEISPASFTETDPGCGDFELIWEVYPDEVVTVRYQGR